MPKLTILFQSSDINKKDSFVTIKINDNDRTVEYKEKLINDIKISIVHIIKEEKNKNIFDIISYISLYKKIENIIDLVFLVDFEDFTSNEEKKYSLYEGEFGRMIMKLYL